MSEHDGAEVLRSLIIDFLKDAIDYADSDYWRFLDKWRQRFEKKSVRDRDGFYPEHEEEI